MATRAELVARILLSPVRLMFCGVLLAVIMFLLGTFYPKLFELGRNAMASAAAALSDGSDAAGSPPAPAPAKGYTFDADLDANRAFAMQGTQTKAELAMLCQSKYEATLRGLKSQKKLLETLAAPKLADRELNLTLPELAGKVARKVASDPERAAFVEFGGVGWRSLEERILRLDAALSGVRESRQRFELLADGMIGSLPILELSRFVHHNLGGSSSLRVDTTMLHQLLQAQNAFDEAAEELNAQLTQERLNVLSPTSR